MLVISNRPRAISKLLARLLPELYSTWTNYYYLLLLLLLLLLLCVRSCLNLPSIWQLILSVSYRHSVFPCHSRVWVRYGQNFVILFPYVCLDKIAIGFASILWSGSCPNKFICWDSCLIAIIKYCKCFGCMCVFVFATL